MKFNKINGQIEAGPIAIMFSDYFQWFKSHTIKEWTLFQIMHDDGAWWGLDLKYSKPTSDNEYTIGEGDLNCFWQIKILGIGIRYNYKQKAKVILPSKNDLKKIAENY
jgi:hypothetical protein